MASLKELIAQQEELARKIEETRAKEMQGALNKIHDLIAAYSIKPEEIFPHLMDEIASMKGTSKRGPKAKGTRAPAKIKYRDPSNAENTWSGRGPFPPKWLQELEAAGHKRDEFLVA